MSKLNINKLFTMRHCDSTKISRMPLWLTIVTILLGLTFLGWQLYIFRHASMGMDSWSYPGGWLTLKNGHLDPARPPVYCTIVGVVWEILTMGYGNILLPAIQWTLYIASLQLVWIINTWLRASRVFNITAILSMLLIPGFWIFNNIIMAESVALCEIVLLTWLSGKYIQTHKTRYLVYSGVMLIVLIFTKPMFIFLIPVLGVLWGIVSWGNKRHIVISTLLLSITVGSVLAYATVIKNTYGVRALTIASTHNKYCCLRADGVIIPEEISDPVTREKYRPMYEADPGVQNPNNRYMLEVYVFTWPEIDRLVSDVLSRHPYAEVEGLSYRINTSMKYSQFFFFLYGYDERADRILRNWNGLNKECDNVEFIFPFHNYLWFPMWVTAVIWGVFSLIWICLWRRRRSFPAMAYFVSATIFTCYVSAIVGAQDLWGRIMTPVTPLIPVMAASAASIIWGYVKKSLSGRRLWRRGFASLGKVA